MVLQQRRDVSLIIDILTEEDLLTMQDCLENLAELGASTLALLCTCGLSFAAFIVLSQAMWLPCWGKAVKLCSPSSRSKESEDFWVGQKN